MGGHAQSSKLSQIQANVKYKVGHSKEKCGCIAKSAH